MTNPNLFLRFTMGGSAEVQVRGAARISVDGSGGLIVYDAETGTAERIPLAQLNSFRIDRPFPTVVDRHIH